MKIKEAIHWIDIARMGYICDPNECGLEKGGDPCRAFHCDEIHDALVMAMDALEMAERLEHAYHNAFGIDLAKCTKYGNESAEQQRDSYSTVMMYEVANVFDDILGE